MDLRCNCLNCQNPAYHGAQETGLQFDSNNKRYEIYGNENALENQVSNIPDRQLEKYQRE